MKHRIKSFVLRMGRMSNAQKNSIKLYQHIYGIEYQQSKINLTEIFKNKSPTFLEIGFGMGNSLLEIAAQNPHINYLGIEVHLPGIGSILKQISEQNLKNIRIINHDAIEVLKNMIVDNSLDGVYLFFPDPWHKRRHHKRRIVQPEFIELISKSLKKDGIFHMATDWENYANHMLKVVSKSNDFKNKQDSFKFTPRPDYRPLTKFEKRGHKLGHNIWDIVFKKI